MYIKRKFRKIFRKLIIKLGVLLYRESAAIARITLPEFANNPDNLSIALPRRIINPEYMFLGDNINIGPGSLLLALKEYPGSFAKHPHKELPNQNFTPRISIGNRVTSTSNLQIGAHTDITMEDDVLFASNVSITDGLHGYENANEPYKYQKISKINPIHIKRGCWIGNNVVILPGVTIGELSIIGANSVVTENIPDRSIAVGSPARVIKKWDDIKQRWVSNDKE